MSRFGRGKEVRGESAAKDSLQKTLDELILTQPNWLHVAEKYASDPSNSEARARFIADTSAILSDLESARRILPVLELVGMLAAADLPLLADLEGDLNAIAASPHLGAVQLLGAALLPPCEGTAAVRMEQVFLEKSFESSDEAVLVYTFLANNSHIVPPINLYRSAVASLLGSFDRGVVAASFFFLGTLPSFEEAIVQPLSRAIVDEARTALVRRSAAELISIYQQNWSGRDDGSKDALNAELKTVPGLSRIALDFSDPLRSAVRSILMRGQIATPEDAIRYLEETQPAEQVLALAGFVYYRSLQYERGDLIPAFKEALDRLWREGNSSVQRKIGHIYSAFPRIRDVR